MLTITIVLCLIIILFFELKLINIAFKIEKNMNKQIAIVQFGEIKGLDSKFIVPIAANVDWYYFDKTADREFEIKDLKEHYDILLEVREL